MLSAKTPVNNGIGKTHIMHMKCIWKNMYKCRDVHFLIKVEIHHLIKALLVNKIPF